jgi:chaperonin cofactor prefoldin
MSASAFNKAADKATTAIAALQAIAWELPENTDVPDKVLAALTQAKAHLEALAAKLTEQKETIEARLSDIEDEIAQVETLASELDTVLSLFES